MKSNRWIILGILGCIVVAAVAYFWATRLFQTMDQASFNSSATAGGLIPRSVLTILLALIPAAVLVWKRSRKVAWFLGGAILYVILFNFGYAVVAGRSYSLSSVASSTDIIAFTAGTATTSLALAWLALTYALDWFKHTPRQAAESALAFTFVTIYLLSLPILLSFAINGTLVTWTTPEMASMFLSFLSLLQALIVAIVGLILTGITSLIAFINSRRKQVQ